jgi:phosphatidate cytidylyltransferase
MTRVLSALVLLPVVIGTIWFLPPWATLGLAVIAAILAFLEYCTIAQALGVSVPRVIGGVAVVLVCIGMATGDMLSHERSMRGDVVILPNFVPIVLLAQLLVAGALAVAKGRPAPSALSDVAATMFAPLYIGLPLGALAWVSGTWWLAIPLQREFTSVDLDGRVAVLLLLVTMVISDSAQYYCGRTFGKRPLAPTISPKKTVEGAIGGVVFGTLAMAIGGHYVFASPIWILALLGAAISLLGIVGDLFESLLKRSAGVKDSSNLIPGHGGVLDRIDSWLFTAPLYYVFVRFVA